MFKQKIIPLSNYPGAVYTTYIIDDNLASVKNTINGLLSSDYIPWTSFEPVYNYTTSMAELPIFFFVTTGNYPTLSSNLGNTTSDNYIDITGIPKSKVAGTAGNYSVQITTSNSGNGKLIMSNGSSQQYRKWRTRYFASLSPYTPRITMLSDTEGQSATFEVNGEGRYKIVKFYFEYEAAEVYSYGRKFYFEYTDPVYIADDEPFTLYYRFHIARSMHTLENGSYSVVPDSSYTSSSKSVGAIIWEETTGLGVIIMGDN